MQPIETPLVFGGGFGRGTVELFGDRFRAMGLTPVAGLGGADPKAVQPEPLVPGSAVSAVLVRGDLSMSGTCTVTYVDPKRLLACGHPITQYGPVAMPMTKAEVVATLASPLNAFKIINTTETVGAFTEDRADGDYGPVQCGGADDSGVGGGRGCRVGRRRRRITLRCWIIGELTPSAMLVSVYQSLQGTNVSAAEMSYRMTGRAEVKGQPPVRIEGLLAQNELNSGAINAALLVGDRFDRVYEQCAGPAGGDGVAAERWRRFRSGGRRSLESARLSKVEAQAGETMEVEATMRPYQAEARVVKVRFTVPANTQPGTVRVVVSDGATVDRLMSRAGGAECAAGGGAGGCGGAAEPDSPERQGVCDDAG